MITFFTLAAAIRPAISVLALSASLFSAVQAQTVGSTAPPAFQSVLEGYQSYQDQPTGDWKKVNDEVGAIGGWREYARQAGETGTPSAASGQAAESATGTASPAKPKAGAAAPEKAKP